MPWKLNEMLFSSRFRTRNAVSENNSAGTVPLKPLFRRLILLTSPLVHDIPYQLHTSTSRLNQLSSLFHDRPPSALYMLTKTDRSLTSAVIVELHSVRPHILSLSGQESQESLLVARPSGAQVPGGHRNALHPTDRTSPSIQFRMTGQKPESAKALGTEVISLPPKFRFKYFLS